MSDLPEGFTLDAAPPAGFVLDEPAAAPAAPPSLWKRATVNAKEGFDNTSTGALVNRVESGQVDQQRADQAFRSIVDARNAKSDVGLRNFQPTPEEMRKHANNPSIFSNPFAGMPAAEMEAEFNKLTGSANASRAEYDKKREANRAEYEAVPSWKDEPSLIGKAVAGATALAGQLAGGLPAAENLIGGAGPKVARAAGEGLVSNVARNVGIGFAENAVAGGVANPAVQAGKISRGEQDAFSPEEFASSVIVGGGIGGGIRLTGMMWNGVRSVLAKRAGIHPDTVTPDMVTPEGVKAAVDADPQLSALAQANGITSMSDPRNAVLAERLAAQRAPKVPENVGTVEEPVTTQNGVRAHKSQVTTDDGTIHPAALTPERAPDVAPVRVDNAGAAYREAPGIEQGAAKGAIVGRADQRALPAPGREHLTDEEIARQRPRPEQEPVEAPAKLYGSEERAPQTSEGVDSQRQAGEAFTLAQAQRERAGPNVADTQPAGRPEGAGQTPVHLDEGHPVDIINRRMVPDAQGKMTEVATVRRYDPRTGDHDPTGVEYDVPVKQLQTKGYAVDPRRAQDFEDRADVGRINAGKDRGKRMDEAQGLDRQTYRQTPPDDNAAGTARASRPEQPEGPHPGSPWSSAEEAVRHFQERQTRGEAEAPKGGGKYEGAKATNKARPVDRDGRFVVDEDGHVMSTGDAPVRFKDQMQAGRWIIGVGQKQSPDQVFEIANHPGGKGFSVRERGRSEEPGNGGPDVSGSPRAESAMHTEAAPEIARAISDHGASESTIAELGRHYDRAEGETPTQAFDRAVDRLTDDMVNEPASSAKPKETAGVENPTAPQDRSAARESDGAGVRGTDEPREGGGADQGGRASEDRGVAAGEHAAEPGPDGRPAAEVARADDATKGGTRDDLKPTEKVYMAVAQRLKEEKGESVESEAKRFGLTYRDVADGLQFRDLSKEKQRAFQAFKDAREESRRAFDRFEEDKLRQYGVTRREYGAFQDRLASGSEKAQGARAKDIETRAGSTLYSNPFADPKLWAWAAKTPGLFSDTWKAGVADLFDAIRQGRGQKSDAVKTKAAADVGRGYFRSIDAELRTLSKKYKSNTIEGIRSMFFARPDVGRHGAVEQTFSEGLLEHGQGNLNRVADILKPLYGTIGSGLNLGRDTSKLLQVVKLVENPRGIRAGTPIHDAAAALRKVLDENHAYLKAAGVDIGKVDGYFPHMLKADEVRRNPDLFVKMAAREMLKNAATTGVQNMKEAVLRAEAWRDHVSLAEIGVKEGNADFIKLGHMPNADFAKERVLIRKSPEFFQRFYHTDPIDSLTTFFGRTSQRAEWAKRFGDKNEVWTALKDKLIAEGNAAAIPQVVDMIAKSAGVSPMVVSRPTAAFIGGLKTWGGLATMPLAWLSSISETAMPAVRSGRPLNAPADVARLAVSIAGGLKKEKSLAYDLGLIANGYGDSLMSQRYGLDGSGKTRTWIHNAFFKATLLDGLTHNQTAVAVNAAQTFVRRLGLDVAEKPNATLSRKLLTELGVSDHEGFSKWVARQSEGRPTVADTRDGSEHAAAYRTAIMRFANQTIMRPSASTFTRFSQHPVGGLVMQLQSFNYAVTNNVLARLKNLAVESIRPGSGLSGTERLAAWGSILAMLPLMGIAGSVSEGRDALFRDKNAKPMEDWERQLRVVSRSGLTGTLDPWINLVTSARYRNEAASLFAGPVVGKLMHGGVDAVRQAVSPTNSANTNTAERVLAQSFYDLVVAPSAMLATLPLPAAIRTPAIQALKLGDVRGGAVDALAGPKKEAAPKMPGPPKMPKMPTFAKH